MALGWAWANFTPTVSSGFTAIQKSKQGKRISALRGLYAITDDTLIPPANFYAAIEQVLQGGAQLVQYRDKSDNTNKRLSQSLACRKLCTQYKALFIINDDIELARHAGADGVHLGKQDVTIKEARELLGENAIIGQSCYNDLKLAVQAQGNGANYVAFGAFFDSPTKPAAIKADPEIIIEARAKLDVPICAIGGINTLNAEELIANGADMLAVINALFDGNNPCVAAQSFHNLFEHSEIAEGK